MLRNNSHVDPLAVDLPAGDPIPADDAVRWQAELRPRVALIEGLPAVGGVRMARTGEILPRDGLSGPGDANADADVGAVTPANGAETGTAGETGVGPPSEGRGQR
jgi:hypothetical protein